MTSKADATAMIRRLPSAGLHSALLCAFLGGASLCEAGEFMVVAGGEQRSFSHLSVSDIRPDERGEVGGRLDLTLPFGTTWAATVSGRVGGSWFDFAGPGVSGKIEDVSWGIRAGVDRVYRVGDVSSIFIGPGIEYGEARSWLHTFTSRDAGPHVFLAGGSVRIGASTQLWGPVDVSAQLDQCVYRAHAVDSPSGSSYHWLGRSLAGAVGLGYRVGGRPK